ncbi:MAG TPA: S16 family serine protease, partial [Polyangiaceae bacterium]|nr:S16 family serine protease [Polyangiaceae bacterium]
RDPVRHAGEFLAMGQPVRKPLAHLELEGAFRLFLSGMPNEARAHCAHVAQRYRLIDASVYKLAILTDAWICQQLGALDQACGILEQLGQEPRFSHDIDRMLSVAALYERIGTPDRLRAAVDMHHHAQSNPEGTSAHGHLANLRRQLGDTEGALHHEQLHLHSFRRSMDRVDRHDVAAVAAHRYLPLFRLVEGRFEEPLGPGPKLSKRACAVLAVLAGEPESARSLLPETQSLDRRYAADIDLLVGPRERGIVHHCEELQKTDSFTACDRWVIGWLLDAHASEPNEAIREFFTRPAMTGRVVDELTTATVDAPTDPRPWRWLAELHRIASREAEATQARERTAVLERATEQRQRAVGRVLSAAVYYFAGQPRGIVHELWASRERTKSGEGGGLSVEDVHGNVSAEMLANVRNVFVAVREYARARFPHLIEDLADYRYSFKVTKEDEESGGLSAGLPTALAFMSVFLQRPCSQQVASTGMMVSDAHDVLAVAAVGDVPHKVRAAYDRELRRIVVPAANRRILESSPLVPLAVREEIVVYAATLEEAMRVVFDEQLFG